MLSAVGGGAGGAAGGGASLAGARRRAKGVAAKVLLVAAVAGSAGSAGYVAVREVELHGGHFRAPATAASHARHRTAPKRAAKPIAAPARTSAVIASATPAVARTTRVAASTRARHRAPRRTWGRAPAPPRRARVRPDEGATPAPTAARRGFSSLRPRRFDGGRGRRGGSARRGR